MKERTYTVTKQEIRRLKQILTFEQYEQIAQRVINIAIHAEKDRDALEAAKFIIERMEGRLPVEVTADITSRTTLSDILTDDTSEE